MNIIGLAKPKLLDLYCGAGGASRGYQLAGFHVVGVDTAPQKRYAGDVFVQADALEYVAAYGHRFDAIAASPPCQAHSHITPDKSKHVDLIPHTRWILEALGRPYIIENVGGARKVLRNPVMLCGADFGLKVYRHRFFESNIMLLVFQHTPHHDNTPRAGHGVSSNKGFVSIAGHFSGLDYCKKAMGIDWMTAKELSQAIPPAYTEFIGRQLIAYVKGREVKPEVFDLFAAYREAAA